MTEQTTEKKYNPYADNKRQADALEAITGMLAQLHKDLYNLNETLKELTEKMKL